MCECLFRYRAGFVIFYDFIVGLDVNTQFARLITCLYNKEQQYGAPTTLPNIQTTAQDSAYYQRGSQMAVLNLKQTVEKYAFALVFACAFHC